MTAEQAALAFFADEELSLREANKQLIDLIADLAFEGAVLRDIIRQRDATIQRLHRERPQPGEEAA